MPKVAIKIPYILLKFDISFFPRLCLVLMMFWYLIKAPHESISDMKFGDWAFNND